MHYGGFTRMTYRDTQCALALVGTVGICLALLVGAAGCEAWGHKKGPEAQRDDYAAPGEAEKRLAPVLGDTVGGVAYLQGTRWQAVRGYGLVVGLGTNGSKTCPEPLRAQMLQEVCKRLQNDGIYPLDQVDVKAKGLMDNEDTAVVEVTGLIPPGACKGTAFDVHVQAVAGSDTKNLEGGRLYTCGLHLYTMNSQGDIIHGKTVAEASGTIFQNTIPPNGPAATQPDPHRGLVLGGGRNLVVRTMQVTLATASQRLSRQITNRINEHFGAGEEVAKAMSATRVEVTAPAAWQNKEQHFYELVMHLPLQRDDNYLAGRAKDLLAKLKQPDAPAEDIALVLEAMGQPAVDRGAGLLHGRESDGAVLRGAGGVAAAGRYGGRSSGTGGGDGAGQPAAGGGGRRACPTPKTWRWRGSRCET